MGNYFFLGRRTGQNIQKTVKSLQKRRDIHKVITSNYLKQYLVYKAWREFFFNIGNTGGRLWYRVNKNNVCRSRHKGCKLQMTRC
jgi:hypothetical protein